MTRSLPAHAPPHVVAAYTRLTDKQRAFALALPHAASQEAAMLEAGYGKQHARKNASTAAAHPDVSLVVNFIVSGALQEVQDDLARLVREACHIALADPLGAFDLTTGDLKPLQDWPEALRRSLAGIEINALFEGSGKEREQVGFTKKVKFWDKPRSIELVAKMKGYLREQVEHVHRIEGLGGLLKEINGAGTGPGPSR